MTLEKLVKYLYTLSTNSILIAESTHTFGVKLKFIKENTDMHKEIFTYFETLHNENEELKKQIADFRGGE